MRSRSTSVYTKRPPVQAPKTNIANAIENECDLELSPLPPLKKVYSADEFNALFSDFGPLIQGKFRDFIEDMKTSPRSSMESTTTSAETNFTDTLSCSNIVFDDILEEEALTKIQKTTKSMVIGSRNSGKHYLLDTLFPETQLPITNKQPFDLVIKTTEKANFLLKHHFWLKESQNVDTRFESLINEYYKSCSIFLIIYDTTQEKCFELLDKELEQILSIKSGQDVNIALLCKNKDDRKQKSVAINELINKHKVDNCMNVDISLGIPEDLKLLFG